MTKPKLPLDTRDLMPAPTLDWILQHLSEIAQVITINQLTLTQAGEIMCGLSDIGVEIAAAIERHKPSPVPAGVC